jgi:hypothetical protein
MAGLDPAIQAVSIGGSIDALRPRPYVQGVDAWIAGSSPAMTQSVISIKSNPL